MLSVLPRVYRTVHVLVLHLAEVDKLNAADDTGQTVTSIGSFSPCIDGIGKVLYLRLPRTLLSGHIRMK